MINNTMESYTLGGNCPSTVAKVWFIALIACPNDHHILWDIILQSVGLQNSGDTSANTLQRDKPSPACMIAGLPGLRKRGYIPSLPMLLVCCYVIQKAVCAYGHTRLPYERCITCCEWFHKACQDSRNNVHVKSTLSYKLQYHLSLCQYHTT